MPDPLSLTLRDARRADLEPIVAIYNEAVATPGATADLEPTSVADREAWFTTHQNPKYPILIAEHAAEVVGWCSLSPHRPGRAAVSSVAEISYYVARSARRRGVARRLFEAALTRCEENGIEHLFTWILSVNTPSIALLESFGFELRGTLPDVADLGDGRRADHVIHGIDLRTRRG